MDFKFADLPPAYSTAQNPPPPPSGGHPNHIYPSSHDNTQNHFQYALQTPFGGHPNQSYSSSHDNTQNQYALPTPSGGHPNQSYSSNHGDTKTYFPDSRYPPPIPSGSYPNQSYPSNHDDAKTYFPDTPAPYLSPPEHFPSGSQVERAPSPSGSGKGIMSTITSFFADKGPPPSWSRLAPVMPFSHFPTMCLLSKGKTLSKGFPKLPPPSSQRPHPFSTHDVNEEDWKRFLADVKKAASLSPMQRITSNGLPLLAGVSLLGGLAVTWLIEKRMEKKNRTAAGDIVDHWNHHFFRPRGMEATLCQGTERLSGRSGFAPMRSQHQLAEWQRQHDSRSTSSTSFFGPEYDHRPEHGHGTYPRVGTRKEPKRDRKAQRREEKRARKEEKRERRANGEHKLPYEIVIESIVTESVQSNMQSNTQNNMQNSMQSDMQNYM